MGFFIFGTHSTNCSFEPAALLMMSYIISVSSPTASVKPKASAEAARWHPAKMSMISCSVIFSFWGTTELPAS